MVKNITAEQLAEKIDADDQFTLIDTRPEDSFEAWHVRDAGNVPRTTSSNGGANSWNGPDDASGIRSST